MGKISKLVGETAVYGLGSMVPRALNFLLFPLHTRVFDPEAYGIVSYLYIVAAFLNVACTLGMETAYFRYATKGPHADRRRIFDLAQTIVTAVSLALAVALVLLAGPLSGRLAVAGQSRYLVILAGIVFIDAFFAIPFARLRLEGKPFRFACARIVNVLILVGLNLYFFVVAPAQPGVTGRYDPIYIFWANLIANGAYILFFSHMLLSWRPAFDGALVGQMIRYASPVMATGFAGAINEMFSRWALEWWLPTDFYPGKSALYALGIFSAAYKYAVIMSLAIQAFRFAAEPFFFANAEDRSSPQLFARANHFFVLAMSFIFLAVTANLQELRFVVGNPAYYEGLAVVPQLLGGYLLLGVYYNFSVWFKLTDKTYYGALIAWGGVLLTLGVNAVFIPRWGYLGGSWVPFLCYLAMTATSYLLGQKYLPIPYPILRSLSYMTLAVALSLAARLPIHPPLLAAAVHLALPVLFATVVYWLEIRPAKARHPS